LLPRQLGAVHAVTRVPHVAVLTHAVLAAGLAISGTFALLAPVSSVAILVLYLGCCAAALVLARGPGERALRRDRFNALAPVAAIPGLLWVLSHSTRSEFLAIGAVLITASAIYWLERRLSRQ
jgi:amino acid transporter